MGFYIEIGNRGNETIDRKEVEAVLSRVDWTRRIDSEIDPYYSETFFIFDFYSEGENIGGRIDIIERASEGFCPPWLNFRISSAERPQALLRFMPELFQLAGELKMQVWTDEELVTPENVSTVLFGLSRNNALINSLLG